MKKIIVLASLALSLGGCVDPYAVRVSVPVAVTVPYVYVPRYVYPSYVNTSPYYEYYYSPRCYRC